MSVESHEHERYLSRIGLDLSDAPKADLESLERLQYAHVTSVPFETLSITGDPFGPREGEGVSLDPDDLFEKIVARRRGGFCYELNGLFGRFLGEFGFEVQRTAAQIVSDGDVRPPANHLTNVVTVDDRRYLADVGMGIPTLRGPLPMDGTIFTDEIGVAWRVVESDRPDVDYRAEYRRPSDEWTVRHVFRDVPREMHFFAATCEYLATAPESHFTGDPVATIATGRGHLKLSTETLTRYVDGDRTAESIPKGEWHDVLEREFGMRYRTE